MGPLSIEWGYNIDKEEGDDTSNWEFRMGGSF
jgi:outer membrane protein insertion porin family